jgi:hypothetical protein
MAERRWVELEHRWYETNTVQCDVCGRMLPRRAWTFDGGAGELASCGPECEELYASYVRPTYGVRTRSARPGSAAGS